MSKPVRWGILGAAKFAREHMAPAIHAARGAELAALATSDPEKASGFKAFCPSIDVCESYDSLLADPTIDAVYIPLPNTLHVDWSRRAAEAGKHVLCEKPIAMSAQEIDGLIALRDKTGLLIAEAYMIVHHPQWQHARTLVREGVIGDLQHINAFFSYDNSEDPGNIRNKPETGGGSLPDIGVYTCGSTRFVTGEEPEDITCDIVWENGVDVTAHVTAKFGGVRFSATTSMRMHPRQEVTFHGSNGILRLTAPFNAGVFDQAELELHRNSHSGSATAAVTIERFTRVNQYVLQVEAFGRTVREGADYAWSLEDARGTQEMLDKAFAAAKAL